MNEQKNISGGIMAIAVGVVINVVLTVLKFIIGTIGNSTALLADAAHSLSDLITDGVAYFSLKISAEKPDEKHPYGHGRAETIGSAIIGVAVLVVGVGIAWEVLQKVLTGSVGVPGTIAIWAALLSIILKEALFHYTKHEGEKMRSESLIANAWHHRSDALSSVAALIGIAGATQGYPLMDPLAAVVVASMVSKVGWDISSDAVQNLMDRGVSEDELKEMEEIVTNAQGVLDHHELKTRVVGSDTFVDIHIQVSPRISVSEAHNIAESVRRELRERIEHVTDALVHIDAEDDLSGRHYKVARKPVEAAVKEIIKEFPGVELDGEITLHFLLNQVCVDVIIKVDDRITIREASEKVKALAERILEENEITEVVIRHNLVDMVSRK